MVRSLMYRLAFALVWVPFFAVPFVVPDIYASAVARDLSVLATSLFAGALVACRSVSLGKTGYYGWVVVLLCLLPGAVLLLSHAAQSPWFVWRQSLYLSAVWLLFAMLRQSDVRRFSGVSWLVVFMCAAYCYMLYALIEAFHLQWFDNSGWLRFWSARIAHFSGPLRQQNQQALFLVLAVTLLWRHARNVRWRYVWEMATLLPIAGVFLTASRSGLIVLVLAALLVWGFDRFRSATLWMLVRTLVIGWLFSTVILAWLPLQDVGGVATRIRAGLDDPAPSIRAMVWRICLYLWWQHPWLGVGWGNLPAHLYDAAAPVMTAHPELAASAPALSGGATQAHNVALQFLVEGGVVAASALLILAVALVWRAYGWWQHPPETASPAVGAWICVVVMLAHGMVSVALMEPFFMVLLAIFLATCFAERGDEGCAERHHHGHGWPMGLSGASPGRLLLFLPALGFAMLWWHVVQGGRAIERAMEMDIRSPEYIAIMNRSIDDPWLHHSALRRYFQKLGRTPTGSSVWSNSEWLAYALWNQYQFGGGIEIMMVIAHNQDMPSKELFWAKRYLAVFPGAVEGRDWVIHAESGHRRGLPLLRISGLW